MDDFEKIMELYKILELDNEKVAAVVNPPENYFELLGGTVAQTKKYYSLSAGRFDVIHLFASDKNQLNELLKESIFAVSPWGKIWVSFLLKPEKAKDAINESNIRKLASPHGLILVETININEMWSASKFIFKEKVATSLF